MTPETILLLVVCAVAVATDVRERKIPDWLTGTCAVAAFVLHVPQGPMACVGALGACLAVFALGTVAHSMRVMGGGDVKLLAAGSLAAGFPDCTIFVLYTFIGGGVFGVVFALAQRRLRSTLVNVRNITQTRVILDDAAPSARMPYAIAVAFGALAVALAQTILPAMRFPT